MTRFLSLIVCAAAMAAGCGASPTSPEGPLTVTAILQAGQTTSAGGLSVTFVGVTTDSRCPAAAICITSGDATLQFAFSANNRAADGQLQVYHPDKKHTQYEGFTIEVQNLAPYPITFNSIKPEDYRVTIRVSR